MRSGTKTTAASESVVSTRAPRKLPGEWVKEGSNYDCTCFIGPLFDLFDKEPPAWPMYSFERPATLLWNAIAAELNKLGWSDEEIKDWLQSKNPRWALDGELGTLIESLGKMYAANCTKLEGR
jgi:hypothetical protein